MTDPAGRSSHCAGMQLSRVSLVASDAGTGQDVGASETTVQADGSMVFPSNAECSG